MTQETGPILFDRGIPSNFHQAPILVPFKVPRRLKGETYPMSGWNKFPDNEHAFHWLKGLLCCKAVTWDDLRDIQRAPDAFASKNLGRALPMTDAEIDRWDNGLAMEVMLRINLLKYQQNFECRRWLAATGERPLVEHRRDRIWGDGLDGTGMNLLGKTLELVRARVC